MQRSCAQCGSSFEVTAGDLAFYDKVSPVIGGKKFAVPPPTLCPHCRARRRGTHINERRLYRRTSGKSGKEIVSCVSPDKPHVVYDQKEWWSDDWDPLRYGQAFDPTRPLFEQFGELLLKVPMISLVVDSNENSEYVQYSGWDKNCYLCFCTDYSQDCLYCHSTYYSKNTVDSYSNQTVELCYECVHCKDSYNLLFCQDSVNCSDSAFLYDCLQCRNCFGCCGLRQKEYCFFNKQLTKTEYDAAVARYPLTSHAAIERAKQEFAPLKARHPRRSYHGQHNEDVTGDYLTNCKKAVSCFDCADLEDCKYCNSMRGGRDCHDVSHWGHPAELCYECMGVGEGASRVLFCECCWPNCADLLYCSNCISCHDCLACAGLRHKQYCILNTQYTKEEYERLAAVVITAMQKAGDWGEYLPSSLSPFAYNESMASDYYPLSKKEALSLGFSWSEYEPPKPDVRKTIPAEQLPDRIQDIPDDVLHWAIVCEVTRKPFKLVKQELDFYRARSLPAPHRHPEQRFLERFALRNPRRLWERQCAKCKNDIQTTYAPERPEIVCCEQCYIKAVY